VTNLTTDTQVFDKVQNWPRTHLLLHLWFYLMITVVVFAHSQTIRDKVR